MAADPRYRTDLFRGVAPYYDAFRPPYPPEMLEDLLGRVPISGAGRLLDLACGTGQIALPLADRFVEVWAVDQEEGSIAWGRSSPRARALTNVTWLRGRAETVELEGPFELVAIGNAFHRLDRDVVAGRVVDWLGPGGCVALLWSPVPWVGRAPWQPALGRLLGEWMQRAGATDRVPPGWEAAIDADPHEQVLQRAGLDYVGRFEFGREQTWTLETLKGFVYSTSFLNRGALGSMVDEFEWELARWVTSFGPEGTLGEVNSFVYELARAPA